MNDEPTTTAARHAPDYRPLAGNGDLTCARCYETWPCRTARLRGLWKDFEDD